MAGLISCSPSVSLCPTSYATPSPARRLPRAFLSFEPFVGRPAVTEVSRLASSSATFVEGEDFGGLYRHLQFGQIKTSSKSCSPRAAAEDVPTFKGYPPMTKRPRWWWRVLACIPYLMPLSETWMYAETAYSLHSFLEDYEFSTYPFLVFIGKLPSWFLLAYFFGAYLGIVRNNRWPHFFRFHVVTGMLLEILVQVIGTVNDWVPQSLYWGKFGAHYWLALSFAFFFIVIECIRCALRGMYADVPFLSDASYMQIPYDT
ncbi:hypothetical protein GOP47_0025022 [Adiantum capillus-veneris]|uniref:Protein TIC 20 n=1 Tax=Adiantum capillus-veneris TaxID=13818 RepID=A0A9D4U3C6_ADICA|nr:hypothetical protein GOP47_0025022 [Adiantum capillus-veneris]